MASSQPASWRSIWPVSSPPALRVAAFLPRCSVAGPGVRAVVWVQGCTRGCDGCCNGGFADAAGGALTPIQELVETVGSVGGIEGVTFSGGEPFDQAGALSALVRALRAQRDLGVVCYTGYTLEELRGGGPPGTADLLDNVDLLIDGPFILERAAPLLWRGSHNQRLLCLTPRYVDSLSDSMDDVRHEVEITNSRTTATGDVAHSALDDIAALLDRDFGVRL